MKRHSDNDALIVNYLLGALPEAELQRFEQSYLGDEELFEELQEIEDELIDDYASGALSTAQRAQFEQYFLRSAERREKLEFVRAITEHAVQWKKEEDNALLPTLVDQTRTAEVAKENVREARVLPFKRWSQPVPAWRQWGAIAAAVLIAAGSVALWRQNRELKRALIAADSGALRSQEIADAERARVVEKDRELSAGQVRVQELQDIVAQLQQPGGPVTVAYNLGREYLWSGSKGEGEKRIKTLGIPADAKSVIVRLEFQKEEFPKFKATLRRADKSTVWTSSANLKATTQGDQQTIKLSIPPDKLLPGDYELVVSGVTPEGDTESVGRYFLKIVRK